MKKLLFTVGLVAAALILTQCSKENEPVQPKGSRLSIGAAIEGTRATMDDNYKVSWATGDALGVHITKGDGTIVAQNIRFNYNPTSGKFDSQSAITLDASTDYTWYVYFPYTASGTQTPARTTFNAINLGADQTQSMAAPKANLPKYDLMTVTQTVNSSVVTPVFTLAHQFTILRLTITNNTSVPITPQTVTFTGSTKTLASGAIYYSFVDNALSFSAATYSTIPVELTNTTQVATGASFDVYVATVPFTLQNETATVKVLTTGEAYATDKEVTTAVNFTRGTYNTANVVLVDNPGNQWTYTFGEGDFGTTATPATSLTINGLSWNVAYTWKAGNYIGWLAGKGIQIGSGGSPIRVLTLTTSSYTNPIGKVTVNASTASKATATLKVSIGGTELGTKTLTTSATDYAFTNDGSASGEIAITLEQPSTSKALYLSTLTIE